MHSGDEGVYGVEVAMSALAHHPTGPATSVESGAGPRAFRGLSRHGDPLRANGDATSSIVWPNVTSGPTLMGSGVNDLADLYSRTCVPAWRDDTNDDINSETMPASASLSTTMAAPMPCASIDPATSGTVACGVAVTILSDAINPRSG